MIECGLHKSILDGSESVYKCSGLRSAKLSSYSYRCFMSSTMDQGSTSMCAAYSVAQVIEWYHRSCGMQNPKFDIEGLYARRSSRAGMSFKEVVSLLRAGYVLSGSNYKIADGVMITSGDMMKEFLVGNSPILMGLPIRDNSGVTDFWRGRGDYGYHAVVGVGFTDAGIELLNSWGYSYGDGGYAVLPWGDINEIDEAWGLLF